MAYASVTRATLRARLQDHYTGDPFWSATEANDAINEALRQFQLFVGYWRGTATAPTVVGTPFVAVPGTLTYRTRVFVTGRVLYRSSIVGWYRWRKAWRSQTTASGGDVPTTPREWAPVGLGAVAIWPRDGGGTVLTFDSVKLTPILTADGQFVDIGDEELMLILDEALWVLTFKRPALLEQMKPRHLTFLKGCLERNDQIRKSAYFKAALGLDATPRLEFPQRSKTPDPDSLPTGGA